MEKRANRYGCFKLRECVCFACATVVAVSYETVMGGFTLRERERWQECALIQIEFFKVACSVGSSAPCQDHRKSAQKMIFKKSFFGTKKIVT